MKGTRHAPAFAVKGDRTLSAFERTVLSFALAACAAQIFHEIDSGSLVPRNGTCFCACNAG